MPTTTRAIQITEIDDLNTTNRNHSEQTEGMFYWYYSGIGIHTTHDIHVLLGPILTERYSVHTAPDSKTNQIHLTQDHRNLRFFGKGFRFTEIGEIAFSWDEIYCL